MEIEKSGNQTNAREEGRNEVRVRECERGEGWIQPNTKIRLQVKRGHIITIFYTIENFICSHTS